MHRPIARVQQVEVEEIEKLERPPLDPKVREECYNIFNDVWYDFDEETGQITKPKYLQVM